MDNQNEQSPEDASSWESSISESSSSQGSSSQSSSSHSSSSQGSLNSFLAQCPVRMTGYLAPRLVNGVLIPRGKRRLKPGTRSLREIRKMQGTFSSIIPKAAFKRLIKTCGNQMGVSNKFGRDALEAMQEASEVLLVNLFNVSNKLAIHAKRVTITKCDLQLAIQIISNDWDKPSTNDGFCA